MPNDHAEENLARLYERELAREKSNRPSGERVGVEGLSSFGVVRENTEIVTKVSEEDLARMLSAEETDKKAESMPAKEKDSQETEQK